ncbi:MAG: hypothetical protein IPK82_35845 [Polyangiaceae bacterium]|nr:hypothetical protein [Polyangiaceae bacterium]
MRGAGASGSNLVLENPFSSRGGASSRAPARAEVSPQIAGPAAPSEVQSTHAIGPRRLVLRPLTGFEEEVIERHQNNPNTAALCNEILARCLVPPGADASGMVSQVQNLTVAERDAALLDLRRISLGDRVICEVNCPVCGKNNEVDFLLSQLPVDFGPTFNPTAGVETVLPSGVNAVMRLPTAGDQEKLLANPPETESERRTFLLASVLLKLGDEEGPFEPNRVRALGIGERRALEQAIEERTPDLDLSMGVSCNACGGSFVAPFDVAAFFLPK